MRYSASRVPRPFGLKKRCKTCVKPPRLRSIRSTEFSKFGLHNRYAEAMLGKDLTELIKTEDPTWCSTDPVDRLGSPSIGRKLKAKVNGSRRHLSVGVYPLADEEQEAGMLVTVRDAGASGTDPKEEKDHLTSLGELSACVAHEIRNPLTGIRTTVQFVGSKMEADDPRREDLGEVISEIDRIEQIIEDLLLFARPVEGTREKADLNKLLDRILDSVGPQCEAAEVEIKRNLSPELPPFVFSTDNMQQVIHNLVRNDDMPGSLGFKNAAHGVDGDNALHTQFAQGPDIGLVVNPVGSDVVGYAMTGEEIERASGVTPL